MNDVFLFTHAKFKDKMLLCSTTLQAPQGYEVYDWFMDILPGFKRGVRAFFVRYLIWNKFYKLLAPIQLRRDCLSLHKLLQDIDARLLWKARTQSMFLNEHMYMVIELNGNDRTVLIA